ncbi:hypothetical protein ZIOFF_058768 [Zingiber officinale]|uniref:Glutamine amidotransferase domain-containing protein n=1 Tax=Zingiber officinale TaxID=94328 RepID=A0A8J5F8N0_ZINOF|nr:hypothetical protein ZIOFF_058768 [Zingiber officinale]
MAHPNPKIAVAAEEKKRAHAETASGQRRRERGEKRARGGEEEDRDAEEEEDRDAEEKKNRGGFGKDRVELGRNTRISGGNIEKATDWIFSHPEASSSMDTDATSNGVQDSDLGVPDGIHYVHGLNGKKYWLASCAYDQWMPSTRNSSSALPLFVQFRHTLLAYLRLSNSLNHVILLYHPLAVYLSHSLRDEFISSLVSAYNFESTHSFDSNNPDFLMVLHSQHNHFGPFCSFCKKKKNTEGEGSRGFSRTNLWDIVHWILRANPPLSSSSHSIPLRKRKSLARTEMGGENGDAAVAPAAGEKEEGKEKGRKKFAVLLCADDSEYVRKAYGGYFKVFVGLLGEEGEAWHVYRAAHGELPTAAEADGYDGFVITGSCNDAHGDDPWIEGLVAFLRALDAKKKKVLGVCFGHQVLRIDGILDRQKDCPFYVESLCIRAIRVEELKNSFNRGKLLMIITWSNTQLVQSEQMAYLIRKNDLLSTLFVTCPPPLDANVSEIGSCLNRQSVVKQVRLALRLRMHMILSRALGGTTGRAKKGWDIGVTCIHPSHTIIKTQASLHIPSHLPVIEFHRDEVWQLPPQAEVLAWSEKTGIEMFRYGNHIMGIQGHPEYDKGILLHLIDRLLQRNLIQTCHAEAAKASIGMRQPDREAWKRLCKGFLKGDLLCTGQQFDRAVVDDLIGSNRVAFIE